MYLVSEWNRCKLVSSSEVMVPCIADGGNHYSDDRHLGFVSCYVTATFPLRVQRQILWFMVVAPDFSNQPTDGFLLNLSRNSEQENVCTYRL